MTILAQLRDCHSCYDERSMVQKKINFAGCSSPAKTLAAAVAVLRACVEEEALGGLMSPRLITDLDVLAS